MALTKEQLGELQRAIEQQRDALLAEMHEDVARARDESYGAVAGPVADSGDEAVADLLSDLDQAEVSRELREVQELEAALARLEEGGYGRCRDCGIEIGFERLRAIPVATRCLECQRVHEKTFAYPGAPKL